jgi:hypothetical protein
VCEAPDWYLEDQGWEERTASFQRHALALLEEVALKAVAAAGSTFQDARRVGREAANQGAA